MRRLLYLTLGAAAAYGIYTVVRARARKPTSQIMFAVTINHPPDEVYAYFRDFKQLPTFMEWLESVDEIDAMHSHWVAKLVGGKRIAWDAFLTEDTRGEAIAWESCADAPLSHKGRVTFVRAPGRDSTEVRVEMTIAGSALLAKILAKPQIKSDLRRLKQILEIGEVVKSDASIHPGLHPAQPSAPAEVAS